MTLFQNASYDVDGVTVKPATEVKSGSGTSAIGGHNVLVAGDRRSCCWRSSTDTVSGRLSLMPLLMRQPWRRGAAGRSFHRGPTKCTTRDNRAYRAWVTEHVCAGGPTTGQAAPEPLGPPRALPSMAGVAPSAAFRPRPTEAGLCPAGHAGCASRTRPRTAAASSTASNAPTPSCAQSAKSARRLAARPCWHPSATRHALPRSPTG